MSLRSPPFSLAAHDSSLSLPFDFMPTRDFPSAALHRSRLSTRQHQIHVVPTKTIRRESGDLLFYDDMSSFSSISRDGSTACTSTSDIPGIIRIDDERKPAATRGDDPDGATRDERPSSSVTGDYQLLGQDDESEVERISEHFGLSYLQIQECRNIAANLRMNNEQVKAELIEQYLFPDTRDPDYKVLKSDEFLSKYIPSYFIERGMEIKWSDNSTSLFRESYEKIEFHSCRFEKGKDQGDCEVSWNKGVAVWTTFCPAERPRRRKPTEILSPSPPPPKKAKVTRRGSNPRGSNQRRDSPQRGFAAAASAPTPPVRTPERTEEEVNAAVEELRSGGDVPDKHHVSQTLKMKEEDVIKSLPDEIREKFGDCVWVKWKGVPRACLVLSPYELESGEVLDLWCQQYSETNAFQLNVKHLIYWYGHGTHSCRNNQVSKVCSLKQDRQVHSYERGIEQGWDRIYDEKMNSGKELTNSEQEVLIGIKQMKEDYLKEKPERGGPAFHESQKNLMLAESDATKEDLNDRYENFQQHSQNFKQCLTIGDEFRRLIGVTEVTDKYSSLELCAGSQQMSNSLRSLGFETTSLDCDENIQACSHMTLEGLRKSVSVNG